MKKILFLILLTLLLSSCHRTQLYWTKPDFSEQEFLKDRYECQYQSEILFAQLSAGKYTSITARGDANQNFSMCMKARGYNQVPKTSDYEYVVK